MRTMALASRNAKEILRDPLNLGFGLGFPLVVLFLLTAIQANIPIDIFNINRLTPGIAVFGLSFISLFSGMLLAKDRSSSFLMRLFASPLKPSSFIVAYALPLIPMALAQIVICFIAAAFLGLNINVNLILVLLVLTPTALLFIGIGLLCGTIFTDKQVGGICGAILTNLSAWLSGTWFDLNLVGGTFKAIANILPFVHAVEAARAAASGLYSDILPHLVWVIGYAVIIFTAAIIVFTKKMKTDVA